ncbi:MAG: 2-polyprenyl-3-methyl-6-methoxy-1,4-benzoquinone monooxygenase [Arenimonas sp.]|nr:2-polyprenyl-3-methyl-6-methoxy-1,4-benzoquinone monooxygenase [Arenimonas sp.]
MTLERRPSRIDHLLGELQHALNTTSGAASRSAHGPAPRANPAGAERDLEMSPAQIRHSAGLMRINHTGEVCAQALYLGQARVADSAETREQLLHAADEEADHLSWCEARLRELDARPSLLNPLWYLGSYGIGLAAGLKGDGWNLGFVSETERQVEAHLAEHLDTLPAEDRRSRAILVVMKDDEIRHAEHAERHGARRLPPPVPQLMALSSRLMKAVAYRL